MKCNFLKAKQCIQYGYAVAVLPVGFKTVAVRVSQATGRTDTGFP